MDILRQLHHPDLNDHERTSVTLVLSDDPEMKLPLFSSFPEVYPKSGDPTSEADLGKVKAHLARTIVILADEKRGDEGAIRSVLKLRNAIANNAEKTGEREVHVIVELIDPANISIIEDLAESFPGHLEAISDRSLRTCIVAQAALLEGIAGFYVDLLSVGGGENSEIYAVDIPVSAVGLSFRHYSALVLERCATDNPIIPIGIHRKTGKRYEVITNPAGRCNLAAGDRLLVIAYKPPGDGALPPLDKPTSPPVVNP